MELVKLSGNAKRWVYTEQEKDTAIEIMLNNGRVVDVARRFQISHLRAHGLLGIALKRYGEGATIRNGKIIIEPKVGCFYWILPVFDPDTDNEWENEPQPARYEGDGRWTCLGIEGISNWPARWVGDKLVFVRVS